MRRRATLLLVLAALAVSSLASSAQAAAQVPAEGPAAAPVRTAAAASLQGAESWAFAIGVDPLDSAALARLATRDVVVVDGELVTAAQVAYLEDHGVTVLGYLSVGTIESYRSWYPKVRAYRLDLWGDWGEWYADVNASAYRSTMISVADSILAKGCSGLFLDNVDMIESHPSRTSGMYTLVGSLSSRAHARGRVVMSQNGWDVTEPIADRLDGWNREDVVSTYDFDRARYRRTTSAERGDALSELQAARAAGLFTTATDYAVASDTATARLSRIVARRARALPWVGDIGLTQLP